MSKPDGGPAFPRPHSPNPHGGMDDGPEEGMSLRDWFAGQALVGWLASFDEGIAASYDSEPEAWKEHQQEVAKVCFGYADAMLRERDR